MRKIFRAAGLFILGQQAKNYLQKYKPQTVIVCGQNFRASIKDDIVSGLQSADFLARGSFKGYNSEIGLPLSILNLRAGFSSYLKWLELFIDGFRALGDKNPPKVLVLEFTADNENEFKQLQKIIPSPDVIIFTDFERSINYKEKFPEVYKLLAGMIGEGTLLANIDYKEILDLMRGGTGNVLTFGIMDEPDYLAAGLKENENGQTFTLKSGFKTEEVSIQRFGKPAIYSYLINKALSNLLNK
ncbi:MAG: hypothetical protein PHC97_03620 [Patescibacteria group bacterium]|nr:hypothetical protein [Patescibacteria group bacterium]